MYHYAKVVSLELFGMVRYDKFYHFRASMGFNNILFVLSKQAQNFRLNHRECIVIKTKAFQITEEYDKMKLGLRYEPYIKKKF